MPEDKPKRYFEWMEPEPKPEPEKPQAGTEFEIAARKTLAKLLDPEQVRAIQQIRDGAAAVKDPLRTPAIDPATYEYIKYQAARAARDARAPAPGKTVQLVSLPMDLASMATGCLYMTHSAPCMIQSLELIFGSLRTGLLLSNPLVMTQICIGTFEIFNGVYVQKLSFLVEKSRPIVFPGQTITAKIESKFFEGMRFIMQIKALELTSYDP